MYFSVSEPLETYWFNKNSCSAFRRFGLLIMNTALVIGYMFAAFIYHFSAKVFRAVDSKAFNTLNER